MAGHIAAELVWPWWDEDLGRPVALGRLSDQWIDAHGGAVVISAYFCDSIS